MAKPAKPAFKERCIRVDSHKVKGLQRQFKLVFTRLDEQQRRWVAAALSKLIGYGGDTLVSRITGMSPRTISRGRDELEADCEGRPLESTRLSGAGRPCRLSDTQVRELEQLLLQGATAHGWTNDLWTIDRIAEVIQRQFDMALNRETVRAAVKERMGWSCQKPRQQLRERDEDEIKRWKTEEFGRIKSEARDRNAYLIFIDESGFMLSPTRRRTMAPKGRAPTLHHDNNIAACRQVGRGI